MSPNCSDVAFGLDAVRSRAGLALRFAGQYGVNSMHSFFGQDRLRRLLMLKNNGDLLVEGPVIDNTVWVPPTTTTEGVVAVVRNAIVPNAMMKVAYAFNRAFLCFSDGRRPLDKPWQFDPMFTMGNANFSFGIALPACPAAPYLSPLATATPMAGGTMTVGTKYGFMTYEDRYGYITGMSPIFKVTVAAGQKVRLANLVGGPFSDPTIVGGHTGATAFRRFWFTTSEVAGQGAGPFYSLPSLNIGNSGTTLDATFTDTELITGIEWSPFETQVPAPPAVGVVAYANRLFYWGCYGYVPPILTHVITPGGVTGAAAAHLGPPTLDLDVVDVGAGTLNDTTWTSVVAGTQTVSSASPKTGTRSKIAMVLHGDGINAGPSLIATMPAYRPTQFGAALYWPVPGRRVGWIIRMRKKAAWASGTLRIRCDFVDTSTTTLATRDFVNTELSLDWNLYFIDGSADTPADATALTVVTLTTSFTGVSPAGDLVEIDWFHPYDMTDKFQGATLWGSEFGQPEQFDLLKSPIPVTPGDGQEVRVVFEQNGNLYALKERSMWVTSDNGQDPSSWNVDMISPIVGTLSMNGVGLGPDFAVIASVDGVYYFDSGKLEKISQEIQPDWDAIDWTQGHLVWCVVDPRLKQVRIGVPLSTAQGVCSQVFYLDYAEGWADASSEEGHGRKWSIDTVQTSCAEYGLRDNLKSEVLYGGRRTSANLMTAAQDWNQPAWVQTGAAPAIFGPITDPHGTTTGYRWIYAVASPCSATLATGRPFAAALDTAVLSFYARTTASVGIGDVNVTVSLDGVPAASDVITSEWKRFIFTFRPPIAAGPTLAETWAIIFTPANGTDHPGVDLYNPQSAVFHNNAEGYDQGFLPVGTASGESGFVSRKAEDIGGTPGWQLDDWDAKIQPVYDTAPIGQDSLARSQYENTVARVRGSGGLLVSYVRPDSVPIPLDGGAAKLLNPNPTEDVKLGGYAEGPFVGLRFAMTQLAAWFSLKRVAFFTRSHEGNPYLDK